MAENLLAALARGINPSHGQFADTLVSAGATTDLAETILYVDQRTSTAVGPRRIKSIIFVPNIAEVSVTGHDTNFWTLKAKVYSAAATGGGTVARATTKATAPGVNGLAAGVAVPSKAFTFYGAGQTKSSGSNAASQTTLNVVSAAAIPGLTVSGEAGDLLQIIGQGTNIGTNEVVQVSSVTSNAITTASNLLHTYAAGAIVKRLGNIDLAPGDIVTVLAAHSGTPDAAFTAGRWIIDVDVPTL